MAGLPAVALPRVTTVPLAIDRSVPAPPVRVSVLPSAAAKRVILVLLLVRIRAIVWVGTLEAVEVPPEENCKMSVERGVLRAGDQLAGVCQLAVPVVATHVYMAGAGPGTNSPVGRSMAGLFGYPLNVIWDSCWAVSPVGLLKNILPCDPLLPAVPVQPVMVSVTGGQLPG